MPLDDQVCLTVTELNSEVRAMLEDGYSVVRVIGEVSNFKQYASGHLYFTLKDSKAQISAVCFRSDARRIRFDIADGMNVFVTGRLTLYEPRGQYQLVAALVEPAGAGELELAFRALCEKLETEGLFAKEHKQPIPAYPFSIAVVTSPSGAAVSDVITTIQRRWPCAGIALVPVRVQGDLAASEITRALELLSDRDDIDLIILGRGGGSLEDLWAFNEEIVARAIFDCPIPIISAVGHETDFTVSDFVADVRAATPTMAGEIAVPMIEAVMHALDDRDLRLHRVMRTLIDRHQSRLRELLRSYALGQVRHRIESSLQTYDFLSEKLMSRMRDIVERRQTRLQEMLVRLDGLDARAILARGYAVCADWQSGKVIGSAAVACAAEELRVTFNDGSVRTVVKEAVDGGAKGNI